MPIRRKMLAALSDKGGLEWLLDQIANGVTMREIAGDMGVSRNVVADWLMMDPERRALYHSARAVSAAALAEESLKIADTSSEIGTSKARLQIETRRWLAGLYDPAQFAEKRDPGVHVTIGNLHLEALQRAQTEDAAITIEATPVKELSR